MELANRPARAPDTPLLPFAIKSVDLNVRAEGDSARVTARFEGEVFSHEITKVPLVSGLTIFDAAQANGPLAINQESGMHNAILDSPGPFAITLQAGLPIVVEAGRAVLHLPAFSAGTVRLSFQVAGEHSGITLNRGLITDRRPGSGSMSIEATLVPSQPAT